MTPRRSLVALIVSIAALLVVGSFAGVTYCFFVDPEMSGLNSLTAWISSSWTTTTTAEFDAGLPLQVDTTNDEVKLVRAASSTPARIFGLRGGGTNAFWAYDPVAGTWSALTNTLSTISAGGALVHGGGDRLFALAGGNTRTFTMYNTSSNSWTVRANAPANIRAGGALTCAGTSVYAFAGGGTTTFMRYDTTTNTWVARANAPEGIGEGGSLTWTGGNYIYAVAGGWTRSFLRYTISTNTWTTMPDLPSGFLQVIGDGSALAYGGGRYIYLIRGGFILSSNDVYCYDVTTSTWVQMDDAPGSISPGGALAWDRGAFIYAFRGGSTAFWRYAIGTDEWTTAVAPTPLSVGAGGSLAYVPATGGTGCYVGPGSVASVVFDTSTPDSRWDMLAWTASAPAGTAITMQVRSSNTLFPKDDLTVPWTTVTGTLSGGRFVVAFPNLPSGRYHQWRAILTSTVCGATPVLDDTTVYFSHGITSITALGGFVSMVSDLVSAPAASGGVRIANPPYDPYTGPTPSAAPTDPLLPGTAANATPSPTIPGISVTPVPNATAPVNTTLAVTTTVAANLSFNATVTSETTPAANATPTVEPTMERAVLETNVTATATTPAPTVNLPSATATLAAPMPSGPLPGTVPVPNATGGLVTPPPTPIPTPTPTPPTLLEVAAGDANLTAFVALTRHAGLDLALDDPGPFTLFAPTDDALRALEAAHPGLLADPAFLARVLEHHVASGEFGSERLAALPELRMLDGTEVTVDATYGRVQVGGATLNRTDVPAANGVLHVVDAVLLPAGVPPPSTPPTTPAPMVTPTAAAERPTVTDAATVPAPNATVTDPPTRDPTTLPTAAPTEEPTATATITGSMDPTAASTTPWAKYRPNTSG